MNKIRVIDLLNKIANGEAPKKILYNNYRVYELDEYNHYMYKDIDNTYIDLYDNAFNCELDEFLNDTIEILEEEKKIPEKVDYQYRNLYGNLSQHKQSEIDIIDTLNGVIDYLKSKGE